MTLEEGMAKVTAQIDRMLEQRWDALVLQMLEDGSNPDDAGDIPPAGAAWTRVSFDWVVQRQKERDLQWRADELVKIRQWLQDECGLTPHGS